MNSNTATAIIISVLIIMVSSCAIIARQPIEVSDLKHCYDTCDVGWSGEITDSECRLECNMFHGSLNYTGILAAAKELQGIKNE